MKSFANVAGTDAHADVLRALLDGTTRLDGLEIDTDLRWELLEGLVVTGRADQAEIDAALASDNTANGQQAAARATAATPTAEAKRAAFDRLVDSADAPNAIVRATGLGFTHVTDPAVLEGLVEPYFAALVPLWTQRSYHMADQIIHGLYPAPLANAALRDAGKAWLDANVDAPPALRRLVTENLAATERSLAAQAADARA